MLLIETWIRRPGLGSLTVIVPVRTHTAGDDIVDVLTLTHRQNRVRGHWRTGSNNSGVEEYLR